MSVKTVYAINWTEYESGWINGPDGYTLHLTLQDAQKHIRDYWESMPDETPYEYSAPELPKLVEVDAATFQAIVNKGFIWGHPSKRI